VFTNAVARGRHRYCGHRLSLEHQRSGLQTDPLRAVDRQRLKAVLTRPPHVNLTKVRSSDPELSGATASLLLSMSEVERAYSHVATGVRLG